MVNHTSKLSPPWFKQNQHWQSWQTSLALMTHTPVARPLWHPNKPLTTTTLHAIREAEGQKEGHNPAQQVPTMTSSYHIWKLIDCIIKINLHPLNLIFHVAMQARGWKEIMGSFAAIQSQMSPSLCRCQKSHCVCSTQAPTYKLLAARALALIFIAQLSCGTAPSRGQSTWSFSPFSSSLSLPRISLVRSPRAGGHTSW